VTEEVAKLQFKRVLSSGELTEPRRFVASTIESNPVPRIADRQAITSSRVVRLNMFSTPP
jgi:hypothetical protein